MMEKMKFLDEAIRFASRKHAHQFRRRSGLPYIVHPMAVLNRLTKWGIDNEETLIVAVCHDLIEDTDTTYEELKGFFGKKIAEMISLLSKRPTDDFHTYLTRMLRSNNLNMMLVKVADRMCNYDDLVLEGREESATPYFEKILPIAERVCHDDDLIIDDEVFTNMAGELMQRGFHI
jgi:(p)ppGpp synthase/HD superfamily hydrolase